MQSRQLERSISQRQFQQFITAEMDSLVKTLSFYVLRAGLADGADTQAAVQELLNEVVVEALEHLDRFEQSPQPKAWLLRVAANLIKRKQVQNAKLSRREPLIRDLYENAQHERFSDEELFDQLAAASDAAQSPEHDSDIEALLASVSAEDRRVLQLAILHGLDGAALARELSVTPVAARVRLHRALARLREAQRRERDE